MSADERGTVKMFKQILRKRGIKYEERTLEMLLAWLRSKGGPAESPCVFDILTWKEAGELLFEHASRGDENASRVLTTWHLVYEALKDARAEKKVASAIQKNFFDTNVPSEERLPGVVYDDLPTQTSARSPVSAGTQTDNSDDDHKESQSNKESEGETVV